jgi:hypothetical protein
MDSNEDGKNFAYGAWAKRMTLTTGFSMDLPQDIEKEYCPLRILCNLDLT